MKPRMRETRTVFPFVHIHPEGGELRIGLNFYPLREWHVNRGFTLKLSRWRYRFRYAARTGITYRGWEAA